MTSTLPQRRSSVDYIVSYRPSFSWDPRFQARGFEVSNKLSKIITKFVWSPSIFKDGVRTEDNFLAADWCVFDFDDHRDLAQTAKELIDFRYIIAPTKSHTDDHHRFRVCIPFERTVYCIHEYRHNMAKLIEQFGADRQCKDAARFFWPSQSIFAINVDGDSIPVEKAPRRRVFTPTKLVKATDAVIPDWLNHRIEKGVDLGERNVGLWGIAKDLFRYGFSGDEVRRILGRVGCRPRMGERELSAIAKSAEKAHQKEKDAEAGQAPTKRGR